MNPLKGERVRKADPPGRGRLDEPLVPYPASSSIRRTAVFPAPGAPVRMYAGMAVPLTRSHLTAEADKR
jgi:hypothetical protein